MLCPIVSVSAAAVAAAALSVSLDRRRRRCRGACGMRPLQGGREAAGATSFAFYAAFGMFIVNLLNAILSHKQMLHFTSASSRGLKTALINELQLQLETQAAAAALDLHLHLLWRCGSQARTELGVRPCSNRG